VSVIIEAIYYPRQKRRFWPTPIKATSHFRQKKPQGQSLKKASLTTDSRLKAIFVFPRKITIVDKSQKDNQKRNGRPPFKNRERPLLPFVFLP
jgi:hypothetical protein